MGFFKDLGKAISKPFREVGRTARAVARNPAEGIKRIGRSINGGIDNVGRSIDKATFGVTGRFKLPDSFTAGSFADTFLNNASLGAIKQLEGDDALSRLTRKVTNSLGLPTNLLTDQVNRIRNIADAIDDGNFKHAFNEFQNAADPLQQGYELNNGVVDTIRRGFNTYDSVKDYKTNLTNNFNNILNMANRDVLNILAQGVDLGRVKHSSRSILEQSEAFLKAHGISHSYRRGNALRLGYITINDTNKLKEKLLQTVAAGTGSTGAVSKPNSRSQTPGIVQQPNDSILEEIIKNPSIVNDIIKQTGTTANNIPTQTSSNIFEQFKNIAAQTWGRRDEILRGIGGVIVDEAGRTDQGREINRQATESWLEKNWWKLALGVLSVVLVTLLSVKLFSSNKPRRR
ncbi:hypothetical protein [Aquimarina algicola]|uniref:Uncharacterized protein n=1 Tax=Aquimarina algicola TaxID=2589995 RepID=A0A504JPW0_9FLAO|nr:hypothetical protein [Aquimarina algicola]TPN88839.1 hypothetical protein FHK87_01095 [Aquimarina algicola]